MTRFSGFSKFIEKLDDLSNGLREAADEVDDEIEVASRETAIDIRDTAQSIVAVDSGELRSKIVINQDSSGNWMIESRADHALDVEYGTQPHLITPNTGDYLKFESDGETVYTHFANHPGTDPQPYLRPALNRHQSGYVRNIARRLRMLVSKHI